MIQRECPVMMWPAAVKVPALPGGEVHVWRASLDISPPELETFQGLLDGPERERSERFHRDEDRRQFVAVHGLLRTLLGRYLGAPPERLQFLAGRWGKPALSRAAEMQDIRFSLSHSENFALFAFARGREVGVDVECIQPDFHWEPIAKRFFSPGEFAALSALPDAGRRDAFFSYWTCKEACVKATGMGFSLPPDRVEVFRKADHAPTVLDVPSPGQESRRWTLWSLPLSPRAAAAIAAECGSWHLRLWQWAAAERQ